jgi:ribonuclease-3
MGQTGGGPAPSLTTLRDYLTGVIGTPVDDEVLERALTHRSYAYENGGLPNNERLEFLGDAVLGLVITDTLYAAHPDLPEGQLAKLRASVVNMRALADVGRTIDGGHLRAAGPRRRDHRGARQGVDPRRHHGSPHRHVYLSGGLVAAGAFVHHLFDPLLKTASGLGAGWIGRPACRSCASSGSLGSPEYRLIESGPDHEKSFDAAVLVGNEVLGHGAGRSKKEAEQAAAEQAWVELAARRERAAAEAEAETHHAEGVSGSASDPESSSDAPSDASSLA